MVLGLVFAAAGAFIGGAVAGAWGKAIGWLAGSFIGSFFDRQKTPGQPRLMTLYGPSANYGDSIIELEGEGRVGTSGIWRQTGPPQRHKRDSHPDEYFARWAVLICKGPVETIDKVWANGTVILDRNDPKDTAGVLDILNDAEDTVVGKRFFIKSYGSISVYFGSEDQDPDPFMGKQDGIDKTSAYRGWCYALFHSTKDDRATPTYHKYGFRITPFGSQIPNINVHVVKETDATSEYGWHTVDQAEAAGTTIEAEAADAENFWVASFNDRTNLPFTDFEVGDICTSTGFTEGGNNGLWEVTHISTGDVDPPGAWIGVVSLEDPAKVVVDEVEGDSVTITQQFNALSNPGVGVDGRGRLYLIKTSEVWSSDTGEGWKQFLGALPSCTIAVPKVVQAESVMYVMGGNGGISQNDRINTFDGAIWGTATPSYSPHNSDENYPFKDNLTAYAICTHVCLVDDGWPQYTEESNEHFLLTGGHNGVDATNDFYIGYFSIGVEGQTTAQQTIYWLKEVGSWGFLKRHKHTMVSTQNGVFIFGGTCTDDNTKSNAVYLWTGSDFTQLVADLTGGAANYGDVIGGCVEQPDASNANRQTLIALVNNTKTSKVELWKSSASDGATWEEVDIESSTKPAVFDSDMLPGFAYWRGTMWLFGGGRSTVPCSTVLKLDLAKREASERSLADIITDLCTRAGLTTSQIDVTDATLAAATTRGIIWDSRGEARQWLEPLRQIHQIDHFESMGLLRFVVRGNESLRTLVEADLAYRPQSEALVDLLEQLLSEPRNIPEKIEIEHYDPNAAYLPNIQASPWTGVQSREPVMISLPVVLTADEAAQLAEILMSDAWNEGHTGMAFPRMRHLDLDPTDIVSLSLTNVSVDIRIKKVTWTPFIGLAWEATVENADIYTSSRTGTELTTQLETSIFTVMPSKTFLLDIPIFHTKHDQHGFYLAVHGSAEDENQEYNKWVELWVSKSSGFDWELLYESNTRTSIGTINTALAGSVSHGTMDTTNTFTVVLEQGSGDLESITDQMLQAGANLALIGNPWTKEYEIIQFQTVVQTGLRFVCSNLLRGMFGTQGFIDSHAADSWFVLLRDHEGTNRVEHVPLERADLNLRYLFRITAPGGDPEEEGLEIQPLKYEGYAKKAPPVTNARSLVLYHWANLILLWERSERLPSEFWDAIESPVDDSDERYEIALMDTAGTTELFSWVLINPVNKKWDVCRFDVGLAEIQKRGGGSGGEYPMTSLIAGMSVEFRIYQMSDVGRGVHQAVTVSTADIF